MPRAEHGSESDIEPNVSDVSDFSSANAKSAKPAKPAESGQRCTQRAWDVPPGGIITDGSGHLRRHRPDTYHHQWSAVPVGPVAAQKLSHGLNERDLRILLIAERLGVVTTEQIARVFFDSVITARKRIRLLRERRFLATPEIDHRTVSSAVGHRSGTHNASLVLDWNGKYLLEHLNYNLRTWDPATVAQANSRFGHTLAISEVWSYIMAAARATHERATQLGTPSDRETRASRDQLAVGLLNERESVVYHEGSTCWSLELEVGKAETEASETGTEAQVRAGNAERWRPRPLVKPDATLVLSITSDETERLYDEAARKIGSKSPASYQGSWRDALLPAIPSPAAMWAAEQTGSTRYRFAFLEMETGSNSSMDMVHKIGRYNRLCSLLTQGDLMHGQRWRALFGPALPTILVAVRDRRQVEGQVMLWRTHFTSSSPGIVVLANLEVLAFAYARGGARLLTQACWLDVMGPERAKWRPLPEILELRV